MYYCTCFRSLQNITTARKIYIQTWHCLRKVTETLKTFILNIKEAVPISVKYLQSL